MQISEIQKGSYLKYRGMLHLIDKIECVEKGKYVIHSFFSLSTRENALLHETYKAPNNFDYYSKHEIEKYLNPIKKEKETTMFKDAIKNKYPDFDFETLSKKQSDVLEKECIEHLKSKGYLILKQM